jgi:hypothetical protein
MRAGGRPSRAVCGPNHGATPPKAPSAEMLGCHGRFVPCRGGGHVACGAVCAPTLARQEQNVEAPRNLGEALASLRSTLLVRRETILQVGR